MNEKMIEKLSAVLKGGSPVITAADVKGILAKYE